VDPRFLSSLYNEPVSLDLQPSIFLRHALSFIHQEVRQPLVRNSLRQPGPRPLVNCRQHDVDSSLTVLYHTSSTTSPLSLFASRALFINQNHFLLQPGNHSIPRRGPLGNHPPTRDLYVAGSHGCGSSLTHLLQAIGDRHGGSLVRRLHSEGSLFVMRSKMERSSCGKMSRSRSPWQGTGEEETDGRGDLVRYPFLTLLVRYWSLDGSWLYCWRNVDGTVERAWKTGGSWSDVLDVRGEDSSGDPACVYPAAWWDSYQIGLEVN